MKYHVTLSVTALICAISMGAQAQVSQKDVQSAIDQRFPNLKKLQNTQNSAKVSTSSATTTTTTPKKPEEDITNNFPAKPWCGKKGAPALYYPDLKPDIYYVPAATEKELNWVSGYSAAQDKEKYVNDNLSKISYSHMSESLGSSGRYCASRASNGNNIYGVILKVGEQNPDAGYITKQTLLDKDFVEILTDSFHDCANYPDVKKDLNAAEKSFEEYKSSKAKQLCAGPICSELFNNPGYKEREKSLNDHKKAETETFKSCMNYIQLFNDTGFPDLYSKPTN